ncbi:MAG: AtpZ/AtpI family protein [Ruminococcaceae bacterium]|nr:AtpZ/AtpI family protein [Oscillospiraceae bacterium]
MKNLSLLVWFTQLAVSVAVPLGGAVWLSVWLYNKYRLGVWVIILGVLLGLWWAIDGLRTSLKAMARLAKPDAEDNEEQRNG